MDLKSMNKENEFVLELCKFKDNNKDILEKYLAMDLNMPYVLGQIQYNRIGGIAYYTLKEKGLLGAVHREFRNSLKTVYESDKIKTQSFKKELSRLCEMFHSVDFKYAFLKGALLASIYPEGLRTSNDYDILVNKENITEVSDILKKNGFRQGNVRNDIFIPADRREIISSRMNRGETVPFIKDIGMPFMKYSEIDINFSIDFKATGSENIVGRLLADAEALIYTDTGNLLSLSREVFLIHLCTHIYKEAATYKWVEMGRDLSLYKFVDIYLYCCEFMDGHLAGALQNKIKEFKLQRECYFAFYNTRLLFNIKNAFLDELLDRICPENTDFMKLIYKPDEDKYYCYDESFTEWIFISGRRNKLREVSR